MGLVNLARGCVHAFAPDGGAHSIAGLELRDDSATILSLFATLGLQQIVLGLFELYAALRAPRFVTLLLALQTLTTLVALINLYAWRPLPVVVPGQPFNVAMFALQLVALVIALTARKQRQSPPAA
ncbi:MAG: hypothetical protein JSS00_03065 [Proteobacteria bacterium]|nr:hypothetical protein [Pseudomonadota bacterium]